MLILPYSQIFDFVKNKTPLEMNLFYDFNLFLHKKRMHSFSIVLLLSRACHLHGMFGKSVQKYTNVFFDQFGNDSSFLVKQLFHVNSCGIK